MYVIYTRLGPASERRVRTLPVAHLPEPYRERLRRMRSVAARVRTRTGLWLLEQGLAALGEDAGAIARIGFAANGRPQIAGGPAFSISHSDALVACAIARGQTVGLDIEARRPIAPSRLARVLGAEENRIAARDPYRFFDFWCAREATVKATGRVGLRRIGELVVHGDRAHVDDREWLLRGLELAPDYAGCLASDREIGALDVVARVIPRRR